MGVPVVDRNQTNPLACVDYERFTGALRNGWLWHTADPGLARHALNAVAKAIDANKTRFDRPASSRFGSEEQRRARWIDALIAAAMVHTTASAEFYNDDDDDNKEILVAWA